MGIVELIGEISKQIIHRNGTNRDRLADRDVYATTKRHREGVAGRSFRKGADPDHRLTNVLKRIPIHIGMRSSEEQMSERLDPVDCVA